MTARKEPFRFLFSHPMKGHMTYSRLHKDKRNSFKRNIQIHNVSPMGCSFTTPIELPDIHELYVQIELSINEKPLYLSGYLVWQKVVAEGYCYGLSFDEGENSETEMTDEIKTYISNKKAKL